MPEWAIEQQLAAALDEDGRRECERSHAFRIAE